MVISHGLSLRIARPASFHKIREWMAKAMLEREYRWECCALARDFRI